MKSFLPSFRLSGTVQLFAAMLATSSVLASTRSPDSVLIFGDSAADQGNLNATPGYAPGPNAPYYRGADGLQRLSNGPMWTERLFPALRSINAPGAPGASVNFAYGAATTGADSFGAGGAGELPVGVQRQVDAYLALRKSGAIPAPGANTYAFIEAGPNDYFETLVTNENLTTTAAISAARLADSARRLTGAGIHTVFVTETPDFAEAPLFIDGGFSRANRDALNAVAAASRANLRSELGKLQGQLGDGYHIVVMPANSLFRAMLAHPSAFGLTNTTGKIYDDASDTLLEPDAAKRDGYLFVDSLHLTTKTQAWQARHYSEVIGAIDGTVHRRFARLTDGLRHDADLISAAGQEAMIGPISPDRWTWFVTARGGAAWGSVENEDGPGWRSDTLGSLVGARRSLTSNWDFGLGLGTFTEKGKLSPSTLRWENDGQGLWLLNTLKLDPVTVRLSLGAAHLDTKTTRDPSIPTFVARGDTSGYLLTSRFEVERHLGQLTQTINAGVLLGTTMSRSHLKAFEETNAPGLNLHVGEIERDSIRSEAGVRLRASGVRLGSVLLEPSADFLMTYEAGDRSTAITTRLLDNSASAVRVTAPHGSRTEGAVRFNLGIPFTPRLRGEISDVLEVSSSDRHEHRLQLGLSASF